MDQLMCASLFPHPLLVGSVGHVENIRGVNMCPSNRSVIFASFGVCSYTNIRPSVALFIMVIKSAESEKTTQS